MARPIFAANWKMNGTRGAVAPFVSELRELVGPDALRDARIVLCVPAPLLAEAELAVAGTPIELGAQHSGPADKGAFTGEVSPQLLAAFSVRWTLVGHSERRHVFGETDALVCERLIAALAAGLSPMLCVGETLAERKADRTLAVLERQLDILRLVPDSFWSRGAVAYEPVWAIGTGETATETQVRDAHAAIAGLLQRKVPVLYGGSVKGSNAQSLASVPAVDGLLVGGASLEAKSFSEIVRGGLAATRKDSKG